MKTRNLGPLTVSELGFGTMSFASVYGAAPDREESIAVIRGAYDLGVTFFDTAEAYGPLKGPDRTFLDDLRLLLRRTNR